ncbi:MAG: hypothetical protein Q8R18_02665 [bacterium]|nr:hypothetical protein [bacterium]
MPTCPTVHEVKFNGYKACSDKIILSKHCPKLHYEKLSQQAARYFTQKEINNLNFYLPMGLREREAIKEYLVEELRSRGTFSSISPNKVFGYNDAEIRRFISLERDQEKYLVVVHSDSSYKPEQEALNKFMRFLGKEKVACVSVFDDSVFYNWDQGPFKPSRTGTREEIRKRIKLLGLERQAQEFGHVTYYKQQRPRLEVVKFTGGVIADYRQSQRAPEWITERELLTVMNLEVLETLTKFDLVYDQKVKGVIAAKFIATENLDRRLQYAIDEMNAGNEEPLRLLTFEEIETLRKKGISV